MAMLLATKLCEISMRFDKTQLPKTELLETLKDTAACLAEVDEPINNSTNETLRLLTTVPMKALMKPEIFEHDDNEVRPLVTTCISEIMRITTPEYRISDFIYTDDDLVKIFKRFLTMFRELQDIHSASFGRKAIILENLAKSHLSVRILNLQCDDLILEVFRIFFYEAREDHSENILRAMETILTEILNESNNISEKLLSILLNTLKGESENISSAAHKLAMNVMKSVAIKIEPNLTLFLTSIFENDLHNYKEIIFNIYQCAPEIIRSIIANLTLEVQSQLSDVRESSLKLLGSIFALPCDDLAKEFQPLLSELLKRFKNNSVDIRLGAVKCAQKSILSNPLRAESSGIIAALSDLLLDYEETIQKQVIGAICDVKSIPSKIVRQLGDHLHDQTVSLQKYTLERLLEVYRNYCWDCLNGLVGNFELAWIPAKILGFCHDKDFKCNYLEIMEDKIDFNMSTRSHAVDILFSTSLCPSDLPLSEKVKQWIAMFSHFEKSDIKAFEEVLNQKKMLQEIMQKFPLWKEKKKEKDTSELNILSCFRIISGSNHIPKIVEDFIILCQGKYNNIWKTLSSLLDSNLTFVQGKSTLDDLLKQFGDTHPQYQLLKAFAIRCSYFLFGKEHVKEMLKEIARITRGGKDKIVHSSMNLLMSQLSDVRESSLKLLGSIFALPCDDLAKEFQPLLSELLKRFKNNSVDIRLGAVKCAQKSILSNPLRAESSGIIAALSDLLLDYEETIQKQVIDLLLDSDETIQKQVIGAICDVKSIPSKIVRQLGDHLHDQTVSLQKYTLERLLEVYRNYCWDCLNGLVGNFELAWIPAKILGFCHDKDFKCNYLEIMEDKIDFNMSTRSHAVDILFSTSLFPSDLPLSEKVKQWIAMFSHFEKSDIKAFEEVLNQKKMLQEIMQKFPLWKEKKKEKDTSELNILSCFRIISGSNHIPKIVEDFIILCQGKYNNIWKTLSSLLDSNLTFVQGKSTLDDLLKQFGDTHPQYQLLKAFAIRCSYFLFGKEHVKEMLKEIARITRGGKDKIVHSSMNLLMIFARFFPSIFDGAVIDMLYLLEEDNDDVKEGVVHILAIIGGKINEKIAENSHVNILLEKLCLKGTRKQAMYAVQAIAAIQEDSGHKTFKGLCLALVHKLELSDEHLATVLQSLGCIAQTAIAIFETREDTVIKFICSKLLPGNMKTQICGLKAIVKIYLAYKDDAHLRRPSSKLNLFEVLRKLITKGEISEEAQSSHVDKSHMRLAAAKAVLRLSRRWDSDISPQLFNLTLRTVQGIDPYVKNQFLAKVHKYLKDKNLHHKYACAFVLSTDGRTQHDNLEATRYLAEFFETRRGTRVSSLQSHCNSCRGSPQCVLSYLICAMAHNPEFYASNESLHAKAFDLACRQLQFFVSVILSEDRGTTEGNKMDTILLIMSVFQTIRQNLGEAADKAKSKILCTLCDLGLSITKDFKRSQPNTQSKGKPKSLPRWYKKTLERSADGHLEGNSTASLVNRSPDKNGPGDEENLEVVEPSEQHGDKSQGAVVVLNEVIPAADHIMSTPPVATIIPKRNQGKRKRGMPGQHSQSAARGMSEEPQKESSCKVERKGKGKTMVADINLASPDVEKIESSKRKRGRPRKEPPDISSQGQHQGMLEMSVRGLDDDGKNQKGAPRKSLKRKSIPGEQENVSPKLETEIGEELVGRRIKVWWPQDKKFYEGVVESYDSKSKRHKVAYSDGDEENLRMAKQRYEFIDGDEGNSQKC